ncbi:MAG: universal stress protein [Bacteroidales bacterium]|nr:universal stress protein [Bacteroidales bacterium]
MENIIVGIDFSSCSKNALEHALSVAIALEAKLTLLYVMAPDTRMFDGEDPKDLMKKVSDKLEGWAAEYRPRYANIECKVRVASGRIFKEINDEAEEQGDALVFVGTHGSSGFEELFIGSSAFKVVSNSNFPVFTIREANDIHRHLDHMLLLIDTNRETLQKVKLSARLAKAFNAKVHILGMHTEGANAENNALVEAFAKRAESYMSERNIRTECDFMDVDAKEPERIFDYAKAKDINLLVCMKEIELYADRLFVLTSFNKRIVNRSPIPVLTIPVDDTIYNNMHS